MFLSLSRSSKSCTSSSKCAVSSSIKTSKAYKAYKWLSNIYFSEEYFTTTFRKHFSFLGSSIPSWRDSPGSTNIFRENEKKMFYLCQVSTGHYEKYCNIFLTSVLVRTPCKRHFCSLHELRVLSINRDKPTTKLTHIARRHRELNPSRIGERQVLYPLHHLCPQ